jgi:hypothetical protein
VLRKLRRGRRLRVLASVAYESPLSIERGMLLYYSQKRGIALEAVSVANEKVMYGRGVRAHTVFGGPHVLH